jgi:hypothetical protein
MHSLASVLNLDLHNVQDMIEYQPTLKTNNLLHLLSLDLDLAMLLPYVGNAMETTENLLKQDITEKERTGITIAKDALTVIESMLTVLQQTLRAS